MATSGICWDLCMSLLACPPLFIRGALDFACGGGAPFLPGLFLRLNLSGGFPGLGRNVSNMSCLEVTLSFAALSKEPFSVGRENIYLDSDRVLCVWCNVCLRLFFDLICLEEDGQPLDFQISVGTVLASLDNDRWRLKHCCKAKAFCLYVNMKIPWLCHLCVQWCTAWTLENQDKPIQRIFSTSSKSLVWLNIAKLSLFITFPFLLSRFSQGMSFKDAINLKKHASYPPCHLLV